MAKPNRNAVADVDNDSGRTDGGTGGHDSGAHEGTGYTVESPEGTEPAADRPRGKRGPKPGTKYRTRRPEKESEEGLLSLSFKERLELVAGGLAAGSDVAALLSKCPELALVPEGLEDAPIDQTDAGKLARALLRLQKFYPQIDVPGLYLAWTNVISVGIKIYSPRIAAIKMRLSEEADQKAKVKKAREAAAGLRAM